MSQAKVVLITGCSSGFGRLMAETLARKSYQVFAHDAGGQGPQFQRSPRASRHRRARVASAARARTRRQGRRLRRTRRRDTRAQAGCIDILINNAGYTFYGLAEAATLEQVKRIMDTNFFGVVRMNRAVLPHMRRQSSGLLVHISSGAGRLEIQGLGLYSASKFALEALAEAYHYELASQGIDSVIVERALTPQRYLRSGSMRPRNPEPSAYGPANEIPKRLSAALNSSRANPQEVVDSVVRITEIPASERPLRLTVGISGAGANGFAGLNYIS